MIDLPFLDRLLLLLGVFAALGLLHRRDPSRGREYLFVIAVGATAGLFAVANDLITSTISPAYFTIAKGIRGGDGFVQRVAALGFEAGFVAGALIACALLYANNARPGRPRLSDAALRRFLVGIAASAILAALAVSAASAAIQPQPLLSWLEVIVPVQQWRSFVAVTAIHAGLYFGAIAGLLHSVQAIRRSRAASASGREHRSGRAFSNS